MKKPRTPAEILERIPLDHLTMLTISADTVTLTKKREYSGTNAAGGTFTRYYIQEAQFFSWRGGNGLRIYGEHHSPNGSVRFERRTLDWWVNDALWPRVQAAIAETHTRITGEQTRAPQFDANHHETRTWIFGLMYPALRIQPKWVPSPGIGPALHAHDMETFTRLAFGKTRYRKDLVKAVAGCETLGTLALARQMRGLVPVDWIVDFLHNMSEVAAWPGHVLSANNLRGLRRIFSLSTIPTRRRLTKDIPRYFALHGAPIHITDTCRMLEQINAVDPAQTPQEINARTWRDLHDQVSSIRSKLRSPDRPIVLTDRSKALDGLQLPAGTLQAARTTHELVDWGTTMNNCIGSYGDLAVRGMAELFGLFDKDQLVANIEITPKGKIRQFVGKHNSDVPDEWWEQLEDALAAAPRAKAA